MVSPERRITSIANTVSASQEEEVWLILDSFIDRKHKDGFEAKMENDESAGQLHKQWMDLIIPGSCIAGEFGRPTM